MEVNLTNFKTGIIKAISETHSKSKRPHDDSTQKYLKWINKYSAHEDEEKELKLLPDSGTTDL